MNGSDGDELVQKRNTSRYRRMQLVSEIVTILNVITALIYLIYVVYVRFMLTIFVPMLS